MEDKRQMSTKLALPIAQIPEFEAIFFRSAPKHGEDHVVVNKDPKLPDEIKTALFSVTGTFEFGNVLQALQKKCEWVIGGEVITVGTGEVWAFRRRAKNGAESSVLYTTQSKLGRLFAEGN